MNRSLYRYTQKESMQWTCAAGEENQFGSFSLWAAAAPESLSHFSVFTSDVGVTLVESSVGWTFDQFDGLQSHLTAMDAEWEHTHTHFSYSARILGKHNESSPIPCLSLSRAVFYSQWRFLVLNSSVRVDCCLSLASPLSSSFLPFFPQLSEQPIIFSSMSTD